MKNNLTSTIKLDRISKDWYSPANEIDLAAVTREEKIPTKIFEDITTGSEFIASEIVRYINRFTAEKGKCVIGLGAGMSTHTAYRELIKLYEKGVVDFTNVIVYNISEFFPLTDKGPSTLKRLREILLDHINIPEENIRSIAPEITRETMHEFCNEYEDSIEADGGLDLVVCETGHNGALAFNEPGSSFHSQFRLVLLDNESRHMIASQYNVADVPSTAVTIGIDNILRSRRILTMAWGESSSSTVAKMVEGEREVTVPGSSLQGHRHAKLIIDLSASEHLTRISHPWRVTSCEWDDKLIRRAIIWLCNVTSKPILKLTDKDYKEHGLGGLVALYGSAYNVNIKVFNELQHTITGWPGGKPNADDSSRPERAKPFPKRVIVFSPHPDDDVISMGGTLKRLVDQNHDVHVAYETSGNIAVGDEDMMRYFIMMDKIAPKFGFDTEGFKRLSSEVSSFVANKKAGDIDTTDIREIKTMIRQAEATIACQYIGVPLNHIHFLRLPFYETGAIQKAPLSEKDVEIVKKLLVDVKPQQVFVAGDLADPHGTHKVCTDAVLAAIDELRDEPWMRDCRVWMYRGAWAEWELDHIEMAVPISPEELRFKRNSILKHQSQMENAPFLGDDDRLFWQRAEARNRTTAQLYENLGLASYEAIEAFVQYHPF